ncbi:phage portal protein, partial [Stenotrophomonas maltophilia]|uniref:phage portal protein n=1 Tax=Stenotrophomonas maltophilia TaxID=40324 RepID=UPI0013DB4E49
MAIWGPAGSQFAWRKVPRYTPWGRLNVIHFFEHDAPDMTRGMTSFTTALLPMRLLQDYNITELESAAIRATYA